MSYFPFFIQLKGKKCLVAGGGKVALRKVKTLCEMEGEVTVVAPNIVKKMEELPIRICTRAFTRQDLAGQFLVVAATDDKALNEQICAWCEEEGILVNSVSHSENETDGKTEFLFPSLVHKDDVVVGITTSGKSPALAAALRKEIGAVLPEQIGAVNQYLGDMRMQLKEEIPEEGVRRKISRELARQGLKEGKLTKEDFEKIKTVYWK
jgi:siroheme synthase-like protein